MYISQKILPVLTAACLLTGISMAQKPNASRLAADNRFITKAAQDGMAEVEMGQMAVQHASNDRVKQFGQRIIDDHSKANDELKKIVSQKGVTVPSTADAKSKATIDKLAKLNGAAFDRAYMQDMVKDHSEDIAEFKREAESGDDSDVKAFASKTLPTLQDHLSMAQDIEKELRK